MDKQTLEYYQNNTKEICKRYESAKNGIEQYFSISFPPKSKILDIGAGSGRDMIKLLEQGHEVLGIEPCEELIDLAFKNHPILSGKIYKDSLPDLDERLNGKFDGILCSAVLMHIPKNHLFDTAFSLKRVLKPGGFLLVSIPKEGPEINSQSRDMEGRLYIQYSPDYLRLLFERIGFQLNGEWETKDSLERENRTWFVQLYYWREISDIKTFLIEIVF